MRANSRSLERKRTCPFFQAAVLLTAAVLMTACGGGGGGGGGTPPPPQSMTVRVQVPSNTPGTDTIWLRTGMLFGVDEQEVAMTKVSSGPDIWQASVTAAEGTVLRYRYSRNQDWAKEDAYPLRSHVEGFHYREALVRKGATVSETIAQWEDLALATNATGTLAGTVRDGSGSPIAGIRVSAGPHQTRTRRDGTYRVYGVPAGPCEITFRSDNGEYVPARTSAAISSTGTTTVDMTMATATMVSVTFNVTVPPMAMPLGFAVRIYGDTYRLGMFPADEGTAIHPARVIDMTPAGGTAWSYTAQLGTGSCYSYTYTLGYNHVNNERDASGNAVVRSICVTGAMAVNDTVTSWKAPGQVAVILTATSPTGTADTLYVTTDDWDGNGPMKMWSAGTSSTATYIIFTDPSTTVKYRYVRNGDPAIGLETVGTDTNPPAFRSTVSGTTGGPSVLANDAVTAWRHQMHEPPLSSVTTSMTGTVVSRPTASAFQTGIELIDYWRPSWQPLVGPTLDRIASKNAQWVQIASVWGIMNMDDPLVEQGLNSFTTEELVDHIRAAKSRGFKVALRAFAYPAGTAEETAFSAAHTNAWYDQFFSEVQASFLYHAAIAQQEGVDLLILSNFSWADDADAAKAAYINGKWKNDILPAAKAVYTGKITNDTFINSPQYDWYAGLDYIGDIWWVPLATSPSATIGDLYAKAKDTLSTYYSGISATFGKPILFTEVAYYSANTSAQQTYTVFSSEISDFLPASAAPASAWQQQADAYEATLWAFAETPWVQGCYSFGYAYFDFDSKGYSIRAKTAEEIVSRIYQQINNATY